MKLCEGKCFFGGTDNNSERYGPVRHSFLCERSKRLGTTGLILILYLILWACYFPPLLEWNSDTLMPIHHPHLHTLTFHFTTLRAHGFLCRPWMLAPHLNCEVQKSPIWTQFLRILGWVNRNQSFVLVGDKMLLRVIELRLCTPQKTTMCTTTRGHLSGKVIGVYMQYILYISPPHLCLCLCLPRRQGIKKEKHNNRKSNINKDIGSPLSSCLGLFCHLLSSLAFLYLFIESFPYTQQGIPSWNPSGNSIPTEQLPTQLLKGHHGPLLYLQPCECVFVCVCFPVSQLWNSSVKESARSQGGTRLHSHADIHLNTEGQSHRRLSQNTEWDFHVLRSKD